MSGYDPVLHLDVEMQTLVRGIQGQPLSAAEVDGKRVWDLAAAHGVAPLLHKRLRHADAPVAACAPGDLQALRRANVLRGALALRQRDEILSLLQGAGIPCLTLKGAALAQTWYEDMSLRPFVDIDLLVPRQHVHRARELLVEAGYEDGPNPEAHHHLPPLMRPDRPCFVELHYDLTRLGHSYQPTFEDLSSGSIEIGAETGTPVRTLSPEDTLIHLCLHVLAHIDHDHGWQLRQLCDISRHIDAFAIDWIAYREHAQALGVAGGCAAVLALSGYAAGANAPEEHLDRVCGAELLSHAVPGPTQHRLLAAFLKAAARGHLGLALGMVLRSMVERSQMGEDAGRRIRPGRVFTIVGDLARETILHPRDVWQQLRIWLPWADKRNDRERLLVELLPPR